MTKINNFYAIQSQQIRKKIKLFDVSNFSQHFQSYSSLNLLIVGPKNSGKKTLIKTINRAFSKNNIEPYEEKSFHKIEYQKYQIKKAKSYKITGLSSVTEADETFSINAYTLKNTQKYELVLNLLDKPLLQYLNPQSKINMVIICLSTIQLLNDSQISKLTKVIRWLTNKKLPYMIVGCKIDLLETSFQQLDNQKGISVQNWREYVFSCLRLKNRDDIYCIENYKNPQFTKQSQQIDFYALKLLYQCIEKVNQPKKKTQKHFFNFSCLCFN